MVKLLGKWTWISMKSSLYVEVFSKALLVSVSSVPSLNHSMVMFWFEPPQILLVDVIDLLFGMDPVPEEEIVDLIVILAYVIVYPYVIN